jgi:hypothetical protein
MRMRFLVAALGVHLALALACSTMKRATAPVAASASEVEVDFAIEESSPVPAAVREVLPAPVGTSTEPATVGRTATHATTSLTPHPDTPSVEPATAASGAWSAPIFVRGAPAPMDTRAPASLFTVPGGGTPAVESHGSTSGGLAEGLADHDLELGLRSGGPVVSAAHAVPVEALVSIDGAGVFDVLTDSTGRVVSVNVADVTSDDLEWRKVARALLAQLAGQMLKVPRGARGVAVRVRVEVIARLPSGAKAGHGLTPTTTGGGMEDRYYGMRGDLSDIGASAVRTVHAREVFSRPL